MSATILCMRNFILRRSSYLSWDVSLKRNNYIVLLPQIPDDTPESNSLLKFTSLPHFSELSAEKCFNAVGKLVIEYESGICRLEDALKDEKCKTEFLSIYEQLERLSIPLHYAWSTLKNLWANENNKDISNAYDMLLPRVKKAWVQRFQSAPIYSAIKVVNADRKNMTGPMKRIVDKHILESRLDGLDLSGYNLSHFNNTCFKLENHKENYRKKLQDSMKKFSYSISSENLIKTFPDEMIRKMAKDFTNPSVGPWTVTLNSEIYNLFLKYCPDRDLRWNIWHARNTRASSIDRQCNNSIEMEEIRFLRNDQAKLLGYNNFAEMSMETKMAESIENALSMLVTLCVKSKPAVERELSDLHKFAVNHDFKDDLKLWDIPYWHQKQNKSLYSVDEFSFKQYFPLPTVLQGMFILCKNLFGVSIKDATKGVETWHEDVSFYKIFDENDIQIASFYLDPYHRPGRKLYGSKMEPCINRSDIVGTQPLAYLSFNFQQPLLNTPSMLSPSELADLLKKFGHLLQHSLTTVPYSDVAGLANLEWDTIDICSHFMVHWLYHYNTAASLSGHVDTGKPLPVEMHDRLKEAHYHLAGFNLTTELYYGALDLELYTKRDFWMDIMKKVWADYMPLQLEKNDFHPCSFHSIFSGSFPASYFSFKWSEMIAADIFSAFKEAGLDDEDMVKQVGKRFRDTYLALGGSCYPSEVFRRFRGRDPSPDSLLSEYRLEEKES